LRSQIINSFFSYKIILVEGDADELLLSLIIKEKNFSIIKVLGKFNLIFFSKIFQYLGFINNNIFVIYDKDNNKIKYNENYEIKKSKLKNPREIERFKNKLKSEKIKQEKINKIIDAYFEKNIIYAFENNLEKDFEEELKIKNKNFKIRNEKSFNL
jgi:predicted ATP-dependent endonuclease of OLD family